MTRDELIWLAGWLEGEGTFFFRPGELKNRSDFPRIVCQAFSTDQDVILRVCRITRGAMYYIQGREPSRPGWRFEVQGDQAFELMKQLRPFMCSRRGAQIDKALEGWPARWNRPREKECACGCGQVFIGIPRHQYIDNAHQMRALRARRKQGIMLRPQVNL